MSNLAAREPYIALDTTFIDTRAYLRMQYDTEVAILAGHAYNTNKQI